MDDLDHVQTHRRVWPALILVLATDHLALGIEVTGSTRALAISGAGLLTVAAFSTATANKPGLTIALAALGAIPLAVTTWSSIITPALATVTIAVTLTATRPHTGHRLRAGRSRLVPGLVARVGAREEVALR